MSEIYYRHKKRGSVYQLIRFAKMQAANWCEFTTEVNEQEGREYAIAGKAVDMLNVVVYQSVDTDDVWVRPVREFFDGRFEKVEKRDTWVAVPE